MNMKKFKRTVISLCVVVMMLVSYIPNAFAVTTTVEQIKIGNVYFDNEVVQFKLTTDTDRTSLKWVAYDVWGRKAAEGTSTITGGVKTFTVTMTQKGYFDLKVNAIKSGSTDIVVSTIFSILTPIDVTNITNSFFGICNHLTRTSTGWGPQLATLVDRAGVKNVRDEMSWGSVEGTKGVYSFNAATENMMTAYKDNDLSPLFVASYTNSNYDNNSTPYTDAGRLGFA